MQKVAPFLTVDGDPYPIIDSKTGHIMWMVDGYTTMANYPYAERQSLSSLTHTSVRKGQADTQINYIRNSVKATVDAYDGAVQLYQWDYKDPVLKAWMRSSRAWSSRVGRCRRRSVSTCATRRTCSTCSAGCSRSTTCRPGRVLQRQRPLGGAVGPVHAVGR